MIILDLHSGLQCNIRSIYNLNIICKRLGFTQHIQKNYNKFEHKGMSVEILEKLGITKHVPLVEVENEEDVYNFNFCQCMCDCDFDLDKIGAIMTDLQNKHKYVRVTKDLGWKEMGWPETAHFHVNSRETLKQLNLYDESTFDMSEILSLEEERKQKSIVVHMRVGDVAIVKIDDLYYNFMFKTQPHYSENAEELYDARKFWVQYWAFVSPLALKNDIAKIKEQYPDHKIKVISDGYYLPKFKTNKWYHEFNETEKKEDLERFDPQAYNEKQFSYLKDMGVDLILGTDDNLYETIVSLATCDRLFYTSGGFSRLLCQLLNPECEASVIKHPDPEKYINLL